MTDHDWAAMAEVLELEGEAHQPSVRQALAELAGLEPRRVVDVGSGPGVAACLLADAFPEAEVIAVDGSPELLHRAEQRAQRLGVRLHTRVAEFPAGLADLEPADLVWAAQVLHHVGDPRDALHRLVRLLRPGGALAVVEGGLPTRWLPHEGLTPLPVAARLAFIVPALIISNGIAAVPHLPPAAVRHSFGARPCG